MELNEELGNEINKIFEELAAEELRKEKLKCPNCFRNFGTKAGLKRHNNSSHMLLQEQKIDSSILDTICEEVYKHSTIYTCNSGNLK